MRLLYIITEGGESMIYQGDKSIISFLEEMCINYNRLLDNVLVYIDNEILLLNIGAKGFKLDNRMKTKNYNVCKTKTIRYICNSYKRGLISKEDAVKSIKNKINELESEVR